MANAVKCPGADWTIDNFINGLAAETDTLAVADIRGLRVVEVTAGTTYPVACGDNPEDIKRLLAEAICLDSNGYLTLRIARSADTTNGKPILCTDNETALETISRSFVYDTSGNVALHLIISDEA